MKAFRKAHLGEFACRVGQHVGDCHLSADGCDVDDGPASAGEHLGHGCQGAMDGREEIRLHDFVKIGDCLVLHRTHRDHACIVDEDVDVAEMLRGTFDQMLRLVRLTQIGGDYEDLACIRDGFALHQGLAGTLQLPGIARG